MLMHLQSGGNYSDVDKEYDPLDNAIGEMIKMFT